MPLSFDKQLFSFLFQFDFAELLAAFLPTVSFRISLFSIVSGITEKWVDYRLLMRA